MKLSLLAIALFTPALSIAQDALVIEPDAGAFPVGTAQNLSYANGALRVQATYGGGVQVTEPSGASPYWRLSVRPPAGIGGTLQSGCYERAKRFADQGRPEIDFSFGSSGCNNAYGRYRVLDIQRDGNGAITSLAIDFAQQCERYGKSVRGKVRFNSSVGTDGPHWRPVTDQSGTLNFTAASGAIGGSVPGGAASIPLTRLNTTGAGNYDNGASFDYLGPLPGGISSGSWSLDFAAPGNAPIVVGSYPLATRFPFQQPTEAGLDFSYHGAGCNSLAGAFVAAQVITDGLDGIPLQFNATFEQRCPNASGPLTSGSIAYNANIIGPTSPPSTDMVMVSGFESGETQPAGYFSPNCE